MFQAGLVRLLDEDKVAFGVTVDARADPVALSANDDIDFVFFDGDAMAAKAVIVRIPATGREFDQNIWMVKQVLDVGAHGIIFPTVETGGAGAHGHRRHALPTEAGCAGPGAGGVAGHQSPARGALLGSVGSGLHGAGGRLAAGSAERQPAALDSHREPARGSQRARDRPPAQRAEHRRRAVRRFRDRRETC